MYSRKLQPQAEKTENTLSRQPAGEQSGQAKHPLLQMQQRYGNRHVQRALTLARKGTGNAAVAPEVERTIQQARGGGQVLDSGVRNQMEPAFGASFSGVRVHTDTQADQPNRDLNARAFTTGQDIFFREGAYSPGSSSGRELLAHELTHVVQQTGSQVRPKLVVNAPGDKYEQEADQVARAVMQQEQQATPAKAHNPSVGRQAEEEEEPAQAQQIQRQTEEEEEEILAQTKTKDTWAQRQGEEEEEQPTY